MPLRWGSAAGRRLGEAAHPCASYLALLPRPYCSTLHIVEDACHMHLCATINSSHVEASHLCHRVSLLN